MTSKDYEIIAQGVRKYYNHITEMMNNGMNESRAEINKFRLEGAEWTIYYLANALQESNPNFNRDRFLAAAMTTDYAKREMLKQLA